MIFSNSFDLIIFKRFKEILKQSGKNIILTICDVYLSNRIFACINK